MEHKALIVLAKSNCQSAPLLLDWMTQKQDDTMAVPGGYITYLVTKKLPGTILSRDAFWNLSRAERDVIRNAFKTSYQYVTLILLRGLFDGLLIIGYLGSA